MKRTLSRLLARTVLSLAATLTVTAAMAAPAVTVWKNPYCGCCLAWVKHMQESGFEVKVVETEDTSAKRHELGIPDNLGSCHTAEVDGYALEGHVPASEVKKLLSERPAIKGLAVPGMPSNSPGMGAPTGKPFPVVQVNRDGSTAVFSTWPR